MLEDPCVRRHYGGVIALDEIPKVKVSNKTVCIVNTDPSYKKGTALDFNLVPRHTRIF